MSKINFFVFEIKYIVKGFPIVGIFYVWEASRAIL